MPNEDLPNPTDKTVIIFAGEFAGQEGYCLGAAGEKNLYAVTPSSSNRVLNLRFDEEFGILLNPRETRRNN